MHGPKILARSLSRATIKSSGSGNFWQYHSRSDRHSKIACWGILFDLVRESRSLRRHLEAGTIAFGVNHDMHDFKMNRKKNLDLVLCTPGNGGTTGREFAELIDKYGIDLDSEEARLLESLPPIVEAPVGMVRLALEAKACMTEHVKALPRLHDELNSSHLTIHGSANHAIAVGFAMVNIAETFVSSDLNKFDLSKYPVQITHHGQPRVTRRVLEKLRELPRRTKLAEEGFDAFGVVVVDCKNDGSSVTLWEDSPSPQVGDIFHYKSMIRRAADLYESRYGR